MNKTKCTYLIPIMIDHVNRYLVLNESSAQNAYNHANRFFYANNYHNFYISNNFAKYTTYPAIDIAEYPFLIDNKNDIIKVTIEKIKEREHMAYFQINWNNYTDELAALAKEENWSNETYPNNGILANYMYHTYKKLSEENSLVFGKRFALFNTGLFTKYYEPIYAYHKKDKIMFLTDYDLSKLDITERPRRANYFEDPSLLLFDWHNKIDVQYNHILEDENNIARLPAGFLESNNKINIINGALEIMKKKVSSNYKLAIPQYYNGTIQLLLPLCLQSDDKPDLALAVTKKDDTYQGHTLLTLDMAYNNARLIARPEGNWLAQ